MVFGDFRHDFSKFHLQRIGCVIAIRNNRNTYTPIIHTPMYKLFCVRIKLLLSFDISVFSWWNLGLLQLEVRTPILRFPQSLR